MEAVQWPSVSDLWLTTLSLGGGSSVFLCCHAMVTTSPVWHLLHSTVTYSHGPVPNVIHFRYLTPAVIKCVVELCLMQ